MELIPSSYLSPPQAQAATVAPAIQTLIDKAIADGERVVTLPKGRVVLADSLRIYDTENFTLQGSPSGTFLVYKGPPDKPAIDLRGANWLTLRDFSLESEVPDVLAGIQISSIPSGLLHNGKPWGLPTSHCVFDRVSIHRGLPFRDAFLVGENGPRLHDRNNDWHEWRDCRLIACTNSCVRINGSQCHALKFMRTVFLGYNGAKHAIYGEYGNFYTVEDCGGGSFTDCDFLVSDFVPQVVINRWNSENSKQLLRTGGPTSSRGSITLTDTRFASRNTAGPIIDYKMSGRLLLERGTYNSWNRPPQFAIHHQGMVKFDGIQMSTNEPIPTGHSIVSGGPRSAVAEASEITHVKTPGPWLRYSVPVDAKQPVTQQ